MRKSRSQRRADKDLVRAAALDLLGQEGIDRAPVDPFAIADSAGIAVQASDKLEGAFSGCLLKTEDSFGILYSTSIRNRGYQRFTVAHELGHFSLKDHGKILFENGALHRSESGFASSTWYEREADLFGIELLIPEFLFHRHAREFASGLDGVKGLAQLFETSLTATAIRYATLSTEPVAVVVSDKERVLYSVLSKSFAAGVGVSSSRGSGLRRVPPGSVTRRLNTGGVVEERRSVSANTWFPKAEDELDEEGIALGRYGKTLTVLTSASA